ncbi:SWIM zinc finger family protein [Gloeobacter violaceus]|uniref:Gll2417 protein n=1 Tax=Gloeobacter violaceus (strain ATCC 29082 / PCC 7421) TaxID=251221 RepID=Q7NHW8_GLOVI|nr:SWIM zinc finger family protein [Gloeobacter violaceus]BAC90358.1 gll2417 [Gloeobacter violaceus PCC 7421]
MSPRHSRTWWGERFIGALQSFCDPARLARGRSYAGPERILRYTFDPAGVRATVRGNVNPYFGVHKEPRYETTIALRTISERDWAQILPCLAARASCVIRLLMSEMPDDIEEAFEEADRQLLPYSPQDFLTRCSCPDWSNPCKHVAGLCFRLAADLDANPLLLFELRGLSCEALRAQLAQFPLGRALSAQLAEPEPPLEPDPSYFTQPQSVAAPDAVSPENFWQGSKHLPPLAVPEPIAVPGILIKTQGDYLPFWHRDNSFIEVMEQIYERVRTKNRNIL